MSDKKEPAFPTHDNTLQQGMTLRDYFAAAVLPVMLQRQEQMAASLLGVANMAYACADYMLQAREKI